MWMRRGFFPNGSKAIVRVWKLDLRILYYLAINSEIWSLTDDWHNNTCIFSASFIVVSQRHGVRQRRGSLSSFMCVVFSNELSDTLSNNHPCDVESLILSLSVTWYIKHFARYVEYWGFYVIPESIHFWYPEVLFQRKACEPNICMDPWEHCIPLLDYCSQWFSYMAYYTCRTAYI